MKVNLISFQDKAVKELRVDIADALDTYRRRQKTQVVSLQAPTGAGKTIIAAALIESIYYGMTLPDGNTFDEQPEAIFVWLSDSPELNAQSKQKIELKTDKLRFGQCVTISEESFDMEMLEDGHVYFLNTQKISRSGKLTQHSDDRQYTIWETLDNTIQNKADRLYFIIDEAHRGAKSQREAGTDTTIMQRFIKGYEYTENGIRRKMRSMPVVLGISATAERFNTLIGNTANVGLQKYVVSVDEVRSSGLLKDRIVITYPEDPTRNNDIVLLEAAVAEWLKKCRRWYQYTYEQHYSNVDPVLVVQVRQGSGDVLSDTNLEDVLAKIEEKAQVHFKEGEVVHCFGEGATLELNGLHIPHAKASEIADDHRIKVVFFKEALSTGWDCPRAETMMSFAVRNDPTYIAQLLGRMIRTPLQMRVLRDEFLNDVKLYLPHFDRENVKKVVEKLQSNEGGDIPTEINGESLEEPTFITWTVHTPRHNRIVTPNPDQPSIFDIADVSNHPLSPSATTPAGEAQSQGSVFPVPNTGVSAPEYNPPQTVTVPASAAARQTPPEPTVEIPQSRQLTLTPELDRVEIIDFINSKGYLTYFVRQDRINDYLKSLLDLATLLTHNMIYQGARDEVINDVIGMIRHYVDDLRRNGRYDALAEQVLQFKLSVQVFDPFGLAVKADHWGDFVLMSETDLDRQVRNADARLGRYGFPNIYGRWYYDEDDPNAHKIDCVLFAADDECRAKLGEYAKDKLRELSQNYRVAIANRSDACKREYRRIMADSAVVSDQIFAIPENIIIREDADGKEYDNHLLASPETGIARIKLANNWEYDLIDEEAHRSDFLCWLRNPSRAAWALCLPCDLHGEKRSFFPDFLIVRNDPTVGYVVDVLEPHGNQYADNLPKAKALAEYAQHEPRLGRIQLIHKFTDAGGNRFVRLELTDMAVRDAVLHANTDDELNNIFRNYGVS